MRKAFDKWTIAVVSRPWLMFALLVGLSALSLAGYMHPEEVRRTFVRRGPREPARQSNANSAEKLPDVDPVSLTDSDAILVIQSERFFSYEGARALRAVVDQLESLDYVDSVLWLDRVPMLNIFGLPEPILPRSHATESRFEAAQKKALEHPLVRGQLLSADCHTMLMMVRFNWLYVRNDEQCTSGLRKVAEQAAAEFPQARLAFQVTGRVPIFITAVRAHESNQWRFQMIGYGMIALMAAILFRGVVAVIVVALAPSLGVFWTLGAIRLLNYQDNPFNDVVLPVMLSLVGLTDGVHLMVQIRRLRSSGLSGFESAREGIREVGWACMLTSLTTAIGFASLYLAHHELVRDFGVCCVIGVVLTFISVIIVIPLACSTWLGRWVHVGQDRDYIDRHLSRIVVLISWVLKWPRSVSILGIAATVALTAISLSLRPDERGSNSLPEHSEARMAMMHLDQSLGGLEAAQIDITWNEKVPSNSGEVMTVLEKIHQVLDQEPLIGHPISLVKLLEALPGEGSPSDRVSMIELLPPPLKRAFYTPERRTAIVSFRVQDLGIAKYAPVFSRITQGLDSLQADYPNFRIELGGNAVWRWTNLYRIVMDLASSLGSAAIVIFLVLGFAYRSVRLGLISIVPNVFPLAITGTYLAATQQPLEIVTVCAFTVCLGIAVDDTIHFLTRFQEERRRTDDIDQAIRNSFTGVGSALIMTTVILVVGFSTVMLSDSRDHRIFSTMGALTIATALAGDLIILPAMLSFSNIIRPFTSMRQKS